MKTNKIKSIVKYQKGRIPVLNQGFCNGEYLEFTNLNLTVRLFGNFEKGCYDIEGNEIYNNNALDDDISADWVKSPEFIGDKTEVQLEGLQEKLVHLLKFAGNDDLRPVLSCVNMNSKHFVSTDAHKLRFFEHGRNVSDELNVNIRRELIQFIDRDAHKLDIYESHTVLHTVIDGMKAEIISRNEDGKYPNYMAVIPEPSYYTNYIELEASEVKDLVQKVKQFGNKQTMQVAVKSDCLFTEDLDRGTNHTQKVKVYEGSPSKVETIQMPVFIDMTPKHLTGFNVKMLSEINDGRKVRMYFNEPQKAICIEYMEEKKSTKRTPKKKDDSLQKLQQQIAELRKENEQLQKENKELKESTDKLVAPELPKIEIVDYSLKAIALFGEETRKFKEIIKNELYGKFVPKLTKDGKKCAGWIVSKRYESEVKRLFA